jgi:hypothetical protein
MTKCKWELAKAYGLMILGSACGLVALYVTFTNPGFAPGWLACTWIVNSEAQKVLNGLINKTFDCYDETEHGVGK